MKKIGLFLILLGFFTIVPHAFYVFYSGERIEGFDVSLTPPSFTSSEMGPILLEPSMNDIRISISVAYKHAIRKYTMTTILSKSDRKIVLSQTDKVNRLHVNSNTLGSWERNLNLEPFKVLKKENYFLSFSLDPERSGTPPKSVFIEIRKNVVHMNKLLVGIGILFLVMGTIILLISRNWSSER